MCNKVLVILLILQSCFFISANAQSPKGSLFIIGGGTIPDSLRIQILKTAHWKKNDPIVIVTLASSYSDESFEGSNELFKKITGQQCIKFDSAAVHDSKKLDSLANAKIIFLGGGAQDRFMHLIEGSPVKKIIQDAYKNGAVVSGSSAGAAVMSNIMITGDGKIDTVYASTFKILEKGNLITSEGLGLLDSVIVDQHFLIRSRYNRLLSAQFEYPTYQCVGIDESTAIVVHQGKATVKGESQVIVLQQPKHITHTKNGKMKGAVLLNVYSSGDAFAVKK
jgi:cyanophycinase